MVDIDWFHFAGSPPAKALCYDHVKTPNMTKDRPMNKSINSIRIRRSGLTVSSMPVYKNSALAPEKRVKDLLPRMPEDILLGLLHDTDGIPVRALKEAAWILSNCARKS